MSALAALASIIGFGLSHGINPSHGWPVALLYIGSVFLFSTNIMITTMGIRSDELTDPVFVQGHAVNDKEVEDSSFVQSDGRIL